MDRMSALCMSSAKILVSTGNIIQSLAGPSPAAVARF